MARVNPQRTSAHFQRTELNKKFEHSKKELKATDQKIKNLGAKLRAFEGSSKTPSIGASIKHGFRVLEYNSLKGGKATLESRIESIGVKLGILDEKIAARESALQPETTAKRGPLHHKRTSLHKRAVKYQKQYNAGMDRIIAVTKRLEAFGKRGVELTVGAKIERHFQKMELDTLSKSMKKLTQKMQKVAADFRVVDSEINRQEAKTKEVQKKPPIPERKEKLAELKELIEVNEAAKEKARAKISDLKQELKTLKDQFKSPKTKGLEKKQIKQKMHLQLKKLHAAEGTLGRTMQILKKLRSYLPASERNKAQQGNVPPARNKDRTLKAPKIPPRATVHVEVASEVSKSPAQKQEEQEKIKSLKRQIADISTVVDQLYARREANLNYARDDRNSLDDREMRLDPITDIIKEEAKFQKMLFEKQNELDGYTVSRDVEAMSDEEISAASDLIVKELDMSDKVEDQVKEQTDGLKAWFDTNGATALEKKAGELGEGVSTKQAIPELLTDLRNERLGGLRNEETALRKKRMELSEMIRDNLIQEGQSSDEASVVAYLKENHGEQYGQIEDRIKEIRVERDGLDEALEALGEYIESGMPEVDKMADIPAEQMRDRLEAIDGPGLSEVTPEMQAQRDVRRAKIEKRVVDASVAKELTKVQTMFARDKEGLEANARTVLAPGASQDEIQNTVIDMMKQMYQDAVDGQTDMEARSLGEKALPGILDGIEAHVKGVYAAEAGAIAVDKTNGQIKAQSWRGIEYFLENTEQLEDIARTELGGSPTKGEVQERVKDICEKVLAGSIAERKEALRNKTIGYIQRAARETGLDNPTHEQVNATLMKNYPGFVQEMVAETELITREEELFDAAMADMKEYISTFYEAEKAEELSKMKEAMTPDQKSLIKQEVKDWKTRFNSQKRTYEHRAKRQTSGMSPEAIKTELENTVMQAIARKFKADGQTDNDVLTLIQDEMTKYIRG